MVTNLNTGALSVLVDRDLEIAAVAGSGVHNGIGGQHRDQQPSFLDNWQRAENLPDELAGAGYLVRPTGEQAPARSRRRLTCIGVADFLGQDCRGAILRKRIAQGEWRTGPLPAVNQLQEEYGVGRDTVLRAIDILRGEGLVFTVPRRHLLSRDTK